MAGWLARSRADVPADDGWLGPAERVCLAALAFERRRADWRLGRWTAKAATSAWLGVPLARLEILASPGGAPVAWVDGTPAPVAISLSHRAGHALAVVADAPAAVGCDLEVAEARSPAFVRTWLAPAEQAQVRASGSAGPALATLCWCGKEAAAKVRGEGLRLDVRGAVVSAEGAAGLGRPARWRPLTVHLADAGHGRSDLIRGWWRRERAWLMVVAGDPPLRTPEPIA